MYEFETSSLDKDLISEAFSPHFLVFIHCYGVQKNMDLPSIGCEEANVHSVLTKLRGRTSFKSRRM